MSGDIPDRPPGLDDEAWNYFLEHRDEQSTDDDQEMHPDPPNIDDVAGDTASRSSPGSRATAQHRRSTATPTLAVLRRILDRLADEVRKRGLVGEERLAQLLFLVLTSRLLDKQVSAGIKGHSASGKSYTLETVTRFFPPEAFLEFTGMSEKALIYSNEQYKHRTLIIYEVVALREGVKDDQTAYYIRSLLSEGRIKYEVTVRGADGNWTTKHIVKQGPTNLIFTTTQTRVHAENETRILSLTTDDSSEQTARVLLELADEDHADHGLDDWHKLQRWLAGQDNSVSIPFAVALVERIPPVAVRLRRDVGSLLALIRAHAVLHQATRDRDRAGRIVATIDDYTVVRQLVADLMSEGVGTSVSATVRETVETVAALAEGGGIGLRPLADKLGLDKSNVSRRIRQAADGGYVRNLEDKRGKPGRWVIADPLPETVALLPDPAQLRNTPQQPDLQCCGVAQTPEGKRDAGLSDENSGGLHTQVDHETVGRDQRGADAPVEPEEPQVNEPDDSPSGADAPPEPAPATCPGCGWPVESIGHEANCGAEDES